MTLTRIIYRYSYVFKGELGPVRDSRAFRTEQEARIEAKGLKARGYLTVVWQEVQRNVGGRWKADLDNPLTRPLDD